MSLLGLFSACKAQEDSKPAMPQGNLAAKAATKEEPMEQKRKTARH